MTRSRPGVLRSIASGLVCSGLALAVHTAPAFAVVGGRDGGPLAGAMLMVLKGGGGVCSGVALAPDVVITAAHCVAGGAEIRLHWRETNGDPALVAPATVAIHPGFRADAIETRQRSIDMALIRLASPLPGFSTATLATAQPRAGEPTVVAGFGAGREGDSRSLGTFRSATLSVVEPYGPGRILLWAADAKGLGKTPGAGACQGDSGGAMVDAAGHVSAVTSWSTGQGKARCGLLTQGVLVGAQRNWIDGTLAKWGRQARWSGN
jgi:S1-C subfamily serine protease